MTFLCDAAQLETTAQTTNPVKMRDTSYGKRQNMGEEPFLESGRPSEIVAFEIGTEVRRNVLQCRAEEEVLVGCGQTLAVLTRKRALTELALSELEAMARTKADEMGPNFNVGTGIGFVSVSTVGSSSMPTAVKVARTKYYPSQTAKSLLGISLISIRRHICIRLIKRRNLRPIKSFISRG